MKKLVLVVAACLLASTAFAQQLKTAQGITIETYTPAPEPEPEPGLPKASFLGKIFAKDQYTGFEQSVELCFVPELDDIFLMIDLHYMAGYRFNNYLRASGGVSFGIDTNSGLYLALYANIRGYFTKSRLKPFIDISVGPDIFCGGVYLNPNIGADFRINNNLSCYLSVGYRPVDEFSVHCLSANLGVNF